MELIYTGEHGHSKPCCCSIGGPMLLGNVFVEQLCCRLKMLDIYGC